MTPQGVPASGTHTPSGYPPSSQANAGSGIFSETQHLMEERVHIDAAYSAADDVLAAAHSTRAELLQQKARLFGNSTLSDTLNRFPALQNLMVRIQSRKHRQTIILAGVIATCTLILLVYAFR